MPGREKENEDKSCCTWPKVLVTAVILIVVGVLIWQFAPIDSAINSVLPTFNNTGGSSSGGSGNTNPTLAPSAATTEVDRFEFMLCNDPAGGDCCNGLDGGMCDLGVDDIMYATLHNAMSTYEDDFVLVGPNINHRYKLETALEAGYRGVNLDACKCDGEIVFCHGLCGLGSRNVNEVFTNMNTFMDENPTEVVAIIFQIDLDAGEAFEIEELYAQMMNVPGFADKIYTHPNVTDEWPTLREAIETNERFLVFHLGGPTCTAASPCPDGLHYYYDYATNNPWNSNSLFDLRETSVSCPLSRTPRPYGTTFFGMNNFVTPPSQTGAQSANALEFLRNRADTCSRLNNDLDVNFVYVDFWAEGDLPQFTQEHNAALAAAALAEGTRKLNVRREQR